MIRTYSRAFALSVIRGKCRLNSTAPGQLAAFLDKMAGMFTVDEPTAAAIRHAFDDGGELAGVVELRRHFPLIADNAHARLCVRAIAGWKPIADRPQMAGERKARK